MVKDTEIIFDMTHYKTSEKGTWPEQPDNGTISPAHMYKIRWTLVCQSQKIVRKFWLTQRRPSRWAFWLCLYMYLYVWESVCVCHSTCLLVCSEDLLKDSFVVMGDDAVTSFSDCPRSSVKFDVDDAAVEHHAKVWLSEIIMHANHNVTLVTVNSHQLIHGNSHPYSFCQCESGIGLFLENRNWGCKKLLGALPFPLTLPLPLPSLPFPVPFPPLPFPIFPLPLEVGPLKFGWESAVSSPSGNQIWCILALKSEIWWQQFQWFFSESTDQNYGPWLDAIENGGVLPQVVGCWREIVQFRPVPKIKLSAVVVAALFTFAEVWCLSCLSWNQPHQSTEVTIYDVLLV